MKMSRWVFVMLCGFLVFGMGCATVQPKPDSAMDSPEVHYALGLKAFDVGDVEKASEEFDRAIALDEEYAPAFSGKALVQVRQGDSEGAFQTARQAKKLTKTTAEWGIYHAAMIRIYTMAQGKNWLKQAVDEYEKGFKKEPNNSDLPYYLAEAYRSAGDYKRAKEFYGKVIELDLTHVADADAYWKKISDIERAAPGMPEGSELNAQEVIDRADVAALFIRDLELEKMFPDSELPKLDTGDPATSTPTDFADHELKTFIEKAIALQIRGLEDFYPGVFAPDRAVSRSQFALMLEDILMRIKRDESMAIRFIGQPSPFQDVDPGYYAFNAIMTCTTLGMMAGNLDGNFRPDDPVSGADALLARRTLSELLK